MICIFFVSDRNKVLNHHPSKQASASHSTNDDTFFKYIKKVFEVPTHPERCHQFNSIDPHDLALNEDASTVSDFKGKEKNDNFFFTMGSIFKREARCASK